MPTWFEFHDSILLSLEQTGATVRIVLQAYVHRWEVDRDSWRGTGWVQQVDITIADSDGRVAVPLLPGDVADGRLSVGLETHAGLVPLPIDASEPTALHIELIRQDALDVEGAAVRIESVGEAEYVEDLPPDMRPPM